MTASEARRLLLGALCLAGIVSFATPARPDAGDEQTAVALFERGRKLARDGRCADAVPVLLDSVRHAEGVGALLNLGSCYETIGKMASAHRAFVRAEEVAASREDSERQREAARRAKAIEKEVSMLVIHVPAKLDSPELEIRLDGEVVPRDRWERLMPVDAGAHAIEIDAPPAPKQASSVTVRGAGDRVEWTVPTSRAAPAAALLSDPSAGSNHHEDSSGQRTLGIVAGAVGVGSILTGTIFGLMSFDAHSSVLDRCASYPTCPSSRRGVIDDLNERATVTGTLSTIAFVAGATLLVGGAVLFFTAPSSHSRVDPTRTGASFGSGYSY